VLCAQTDGLRAEIRTDIRVCHVVSGPCTVRENKTNLEEERLAASVGRPEALVLAFLSGLCLLEQFPPGLKPVLHLSPMAELDYNGSDRCPKTCQQRRLLECCCVSVFSDGVLHVVQYVFGLAYYVVLGLTVLCTDPTAEGPGPLLSQLDWIQGAGLVLFVGASLLQHQSMVLLARLRTGNTGRVETLAHRMPEGGCFQLVSCPHYFAELLIYVSLSLVFGGLSLTWWLVVLYVLFNQALAGQLSHELYISRYKSYPKCRRAFIPYVF
ncbi:polyprenal reductase, partial [Austrofundulus limnaeus]|uniref:Polyprenal reductase n=1 Tax=Austrofundulus limnaeus TaxID=52670 RepID=A0A2I4DCN5_AUSLI